MIKIFTTLTLLLALSSATFAQQLTQNLPLVPAPPMPQIPDTQEPLSEWLLLPTEFLCGTREKIFTVIASRTQTAKFGGSSIVISKRNGQAFTVSTLFAVNERNGSWTLLAVFKDGIACIMASGGDHTVY